MSSRAAATGVVLAVTAGLAGIAIVVLGMTVPQSDNAPVAAAAGSPGAAAAASPTVVDHCYIEGMIPHHEQALELSGLVLAADGVRERTRALAEFIVVDQSTEIDTMNSWQDAWSRAVPSAGAASGHGAHGARVGAASAEASAAPTGCTGHGAHTTMAGMATPEQLTALAAAQGADADRLFLELMIVHHEGALDMATTAVTEGSNAFVRSSAKHVLVEQAREIAAMTELLAEAP